MIGVCSTCGQDRPTEKYLTIADPPTCKACYNKLPQVRAKNYAAYQRFMRERGGRAAQQKRGKARRLADKLAAFDAYGGRYCKCWGESRLEFLQLDHIHGGGTKHRKVVRAAGKTLYTWLRDAGYPEGYRVLCCNCNFSRGAFGYCPHEKENHAGAQDDSPLTLRSELEE